MNSKAKFALIGLPVLLIACVTPREQCISRATQDYNALTSAISETSSNIGRGYAILNQRVPYNYASTCYDSYTGYNYSCQQTGYRNQQTPVAIDVNQERIKLANLNRLLPSYEAQAKTGIAQCDTQYPVET